MDNFANDLCGLVLHVIAIRKETISMCKDNDYYFLCPLSNPFFRDIAFKKEAPTEPRFQFTVCYRHGDSYGVNTQLFQTPAELRVYSKRFYCIRAP